MECYTSKWRMIGLLGLTCAMVGMCYACARIPETIACVVGWVGVGFFGLGFIVFPIMLFKTGPQVVIDDEGIDDRRLKIGVICWEDIRWLDVRSVHSTWFLCLELEDTEKYLSRLPRWKRALATANQAVGFPPFCIAITGLRPGIKEVWAYIEEIGLAPVDEEDWPIEPQPRNPIGPG